MAICVICLCRVCVVVCVYPCARARVSRGAWLFRRYSSARNDHMDPKHMSLAKRTEAFEVLVGQIVSPVNSQQQNSAQLANGQSSGSGGGGGGGGHGHGGGGHGVRGGRGK